MLNKKIMILAIFLVSLLAVSAVSAADNATEDIVSAEETTEFIQSYDDFVRSNNLENDNINSDNITSNQNISGGNKLQDDISLPNDVLSKTSQSSKVSPTHTSYHVYAYPTTLKWGTVGSIKMGVDPCYYTDNDYYSYDFYLIVYDSTGHSLLKKRYTGTSPPPTNELSYTINAGYNPGNYSIKLINARDNYPVGGGTLSITGPYPSNSIPSSKPSAEPAPSKPTHYPPTHSEPNPPLPSSPPHNSYRYSVNVSDVLISYESGGNIPINVSLAVNDYDYRYNFYLKVYDSNNREVINENYSGVSLTTELNYYVGAMELEPGIYTIKIVNYCDKEIMDTAKLIVMAVPSLSNSPSRGDYSVSVNDVMVTYEYGGKIPISISPAHSKDKYRYNFYFQVYDAKNNLIIGKNYYDTSWNGNINHYIGAKELSPGTYKIEIVNFADNLPLDSAFLLVSYSNGTSPSSSDYSVNVSDVMMDYGSEEFIPISISPASSSDKYKYNFYFEVYDSKNNLKISKNYYSSYPFNGINHYIDRYELSRGEYTIMIVNFADHKVMDIAKLIVWAKTTPSASDYSVYASNVMMTYGSNGNIPISIYPAPSLFKYKYYFYLEIYDSSNDLIIRKDYSSTSPTTEITHDISANELEPGTYTIKIVNYDYTVLGTAELIVRYPSDSPSSTEYSVNVPNVKIYYESGGDIPISISPSNNPNYIYQFDFYLTVTDSNKHEIMFKRYYGTYPTTKLNHHISAKELKPETYTIKIVNSDDLKVMDTASLIVNKMPTKKEQSKIFLRNALYFVTQTKMVQVTLWDGNNKPIANKMVYIKAYNSVWKGVTDKNGDAYIRVGIGFGVHDATVSFDGDNQYAASSKVGKIRVIKETPSVMVRGVDTQFKTSVNSKVVKVYLWDRTSKPLPVGSKIFIRINGQQFVGTTDSQGIAHVKININYAGTFNAQVIYTGNTAYNAVTRDIKIRIV